eukprot:scaffold231771_cov31-Tisochrysis_lutea.AAC.7
MPWGFSARAPAPPSKFGGPPSSKYGKYGKDVILGTERLGRLAQVERCCILQQNPETSPLPSLALSLLALYSLLVDIRVMVDTFIPLSSAL